MSVISWGRPTIYIGTVVEDGPSIAYDLLPTPKKDTTKLTPTAGEQVDAQEEGGELVDSRNAKNSYQFEFDLFVKNNEPIPNCITSHDGLIKSQVSIKLIPEDATCKGIQIDRASIRVEESYTAADGILFHYVAKPLKPKEGDIVKYQVNTAPPS